MRVRDRFDFVVQSLRESRVFFAVNVVAISLGVSLLTVLLALSSGIEQAIRRMMAEQVSPLLIEVIAGSSADASVTAKGVAEMRAIPHVARAEPVIMPIFAELYRSPSQHVFISAMSTAG